MIGQVRQYPGDGLDRGNSWLSCSQLPNTRLLRRFCKVVTSYHVYQVGFGSEQISADSKLIFST